MSYILLKLILLFSSPTTTLDHITLPGKTYENFVGRFLPYLKRKNIGDDKMKKIFHYYESKGMMRMSFGIATSKDDLDKVISVLKDDVLANPSRILQESRRLEDEITRAVDDLGLEKKKKQNGPSSRTESVEEMMANCGMTCCKKTYLTGMNKISSSVDVSDTGDVSSDTNNDDHTPDYYSSEIEC